MIYLISCMDMLQSTMSVECDVLNQKDAVLKQRAMMVG